jgi:acetyltransferase-like isoleucine patch superfamily enzyme
MTADAADIARKKAAAPGLKVPPPDAAMTTLRKLRNAIAAAIFNAVITHIPSHTVRQGYLRAFGAHIGRGTAIMRGTQVFGIEFLTIGDETAIGWRCMLDARGGLYIGNNITIASDVHILGGARDINHRDFALVPIPTVVEDYAWIACRAMVLPSHFKRGAVVAGQAFVMTDVGECEVVGGNPAKVIAKRDPDALQYSGSYRPLFS